MGEYEAMVSIDIRKSRLASERIAVDVDERGVAIAPRETLRAQALASARRALRESERSGVDEVRVRFPQRCGGDEFRFRREELTSEETTED